MLVIYYNYCMAITSTLLTEKYIILFIVNIIIQCIDTIIIIKKIIINHNNNNLFKTPQAKLE